MIGSQHHHKNTETEQNKTLHSWDHTVACFWVFYSLTHVSRLSQTFNLLNILSIIAIDRWHRNGRLLILYYSGWKDLQKWGPTLILETNPDQDMFLLRTEGKDHASSFSPSTTAFFLFACKSLSIYCVAGLQ
jgi:hypothetical protein